MLRGISGGQRKRVTTGIAKILNSLICHDCIILEDLVAKKYQGFQISSVSHCEDFFLEPQHIIPMILLFYAT